MKALQTTSLWLDPKYDNAFRRELAHAVKDSDLRGCKPLPAFVWLYKNDAAEHLYKAISRAAPLFPVKSYRGGVSSWVSPPPSGGGNRICLVVGKDKTDAVRIVGGNYFHNLGLPPTQYISGADFFHAYDSGSKNSNQHLVRQATANWLGLLPRANLQNIDRGCAWAKTMPVYVTVLDDSAGKSLFAYGPALVDGLRPADFTYEYFGEFMP